MRLDHDIISAFIPEKARVLDLGCGDGSLLALLKAEKEVSALGIEIDPDKFNACIDKGVSVIEHNLDQGLSNFQDNSFDVVILSQTLQALDHPDKVLDEMFRVGKQAVVAFPNFGHWRSRLHLVTKGRMPVSEFMPYEWYNTPNIHFCTVKDFEALCHERQYRILQREVTVGQERVEGLSSRWPNLFSSTAIYYLSR